MKTLNDQFQRDSYIRWAITAFVSSLLIIGAGSFVVQSHFYNSALSDVRELSTAALAELKNLNDDADLRRNAALEQVAGEQEAIRQRQFESVERKLDAILERVAK